MLLGGILICYCNTFTLLARPMLLTCAIQRLSVGTGFSIVYGALFTKTNRISRIFDSVIARSRSFTDRPVAIPSHRPLAERQFQQSAPYRTRHLADKSVTTCLSKESQHEIRAEK